MTLTWRCLFFVVALFAFLWVLPCPLSAGESDPHRVLFVSSYHPGFPTFFQQVNGLKSVFDGTRVLLDVEFMDSKRFPDQESLDRFYLSLSTKLSRIEPYDIVIVGDDNALLFALKYQQTLFADLPIVFLGVNNLDRAQEQNDNPQITGVVEAVSMQETLETITRLHPDVSRIVALVDETPSGQSDLKTFYRYKKDVAPVILSEISLGQYSFEAFAEQLRSLGDRDVVLLLSAYRDKDGQAMLFHKSLQLISENLSRPLYHLWSHGMGEGILGGKVISHFEQGRAAADIALNVLTGTPVREIPVLRESPNSYVFDYREMKRFGLHIADLPEESVVLHKPQTYYQKHKLLIWVVVCILAGYSTLLVIMWNSILSRKKAEKHLREIDRNKTEFINTVAHEFRTPLTSIQGFSEVLLNRDQLSDEEQREFVGYIHDRSVSLSALVNEILDVSRIEAGKGLPLTLSACPVTEVFDQVELYMKKQEGHRQFEVFLADGDTRLMVDKVKIRQVLENLLSNAVKFSEEESLIQVRGEAGDRSYRFSVIDQGVGMTLEQVKKVFDKFYRADTSGTAAEGVGLGMNVVKYIVENHGGKIWVKSALGVGTTVSFTLPIDRMNDAAA
ncbi:MAG: hypothetical protein C0614_14620 [Desulfuromonas sp.]|nr:MAG: hypothetical protein C0614_14620 [Desulfuromonas sp.]